MSGAELSGVILAGTHHWSGSSFERLAPRPLVPVAQAPLISYPLRWLREGGVRRVTVCLNGPTRAVQLAMGDGHELGMEVDYYQDRTPRGPAGCVRDAGVGMGARTLVVTGGSAIPTVDFADLLETHRASGAAMTAVVYRAASAAAPTPGGLYVFERRVLDFVPASGFQDIKENLIPKLRRAGERVLAYEDGGFPPHVLNAQTYLAVNHWVLRRLADEGGHSLLLDPTSTVEEGARLVGPVQLGPGTRVQAGATIVGPTSIGADCTVEADALVARSVVWNRCRVESGAMVHGCVLASDATVPAGLRLFYAIRASDPAAARAVRMTLRRLKPAAAAAPPAGAGAELGPRLPGSFLAMAETVE